MLPQDSVVFLVHADGIANLLRLAMPVMMPGVEIMNVPKAIAAEGKILLGTIRPTRRLAILFWLDAYADQLVSADWNTIQLANCWDEHSQRHGAKVIQIEIKERT